MNHLIQKLYLLRKKINVEEKEKEKNMIIIMMSMINSLMIMREEKLNVLFSLISLHI